ncbi:MAG: gamma-glutamylcyclotransferase [Bacteroidales bacterium]|nr:gamma-glutamylcyclotransferase [Bacteroidales bacterium]
MKGLLLRLRNPEENLKVFDDYEGIGPRYPEPWEYKRILHPVNCINGEIRKAWVYMNNL